MAKEKPIDRPSSPPNEPPTSYLFTVEQVETVASIFSEMDKLQSNLNFFLNHVVREAKLAKTANGYALNEHRTGLIPRDTPPVGA